VDPNTLEAIINTKIMVPNKIPPTINNGKFFFVSYLLEVNVDLTIKKTIFESSSRIGKHDYVHLRKRLGKYNGFFSIPLVIGTANSNDYDNNNNNRQIDMQSPSDLYLPVPNPLHRHHARRSSERTIVSTNNSFLSISFYGDNSNGIISPVPSAPSVEELDISENDLNNDCYYPQYNNTSLLAPSLNSI